MKYVIFRHGQTEGNAKKMWVGQTTDIELNENGINQAYALAEKLKDIKLDAVFSSSLQRSLKTAEIVTSAQPENVPIFAEDGLREGNCGVAEKLSIAEARECWPEIARSWQIFKKENFSVRFPEGESIGEMSERVFAVLDRISENDALKTVGISVHGGVMGMIFATLGLEHPIIPNCSYFILEGGAKQGYRMIGGLCG